MTRDSTKPELKEVAFIFFVGFLLGIGAALSCMPLEKQEESLFELEAPANEELDAEVREFMTYLSDKYQLKRVSIEVEEKGR